MSTDRGAAEAPLATGAAERRPGNPVLLLVIVLLIGVALGGWLDPFGMLETRVSHGVDLAFTNFAKAEVVQLDQTIDSLVKEQQKLEDGVVGETFDAEVQWIKGMEEPLRFMLDQLVGRTSGLEQALESGQYDQQWFRGEACDIVMRTRLSRHFIAEAGLTLEAVNAVIPP